MLDRFKKKKVLDLKVTISNWTASLTEMPTVTA